MFPEEATLKRMLDATPPPTYVVVCRGPHCRERGAMPLRQRLVQLLRGQEQSRLVGYACFGQCELGPNVAFYPEATWYGGLNQPDAAERVVQHALGIRQLSEPPLRLPDDERREHLANIAELVSTVERDRLHAPWWRRWLPVLSRG
jgi:NADH-quinone oxidoreductase subunit F/NADP-reducing hydrogenase subunit HndC